MNGVWSFVNEQTGKATGQRFSGPEDALAANTPMGCSAVAGILEAEPRDDPELRRSRIQERIEALERQQSRPLREIAVDPTNDEARRRIGEIEAQIATLRMEI